ncbi:MAG: hypothetical protein KF795_01860 [Labilithrix sp.]|nr:hypothetical protein [Labilithrix sp.]
MTQLLPPKKEVALALLERSNVDVYLDPRAKGVVVPPQFRKEPRLILKIGLNMPVPIPDLRLDDESMSCTLSFNRAKFFCVVPWLSVFAMVGDDGRGMVWPDDVPQELAVRAEGPRPAAPPGPTAVPAPSSGRGKGKSRIQPDAPREATAEGAPSDRGARAKRPRKKKEETARPVLVAVPPPEKSSPRIEKLDDRREASASADRAPPTPRIAGPASPPRPKRELPPYLRVVK